MRSFRATTMVVVLAMAGGLRAVEGQGATRVAAGKRTSAAITVADLRTRLFLIADDSLAGRETGSIGDFTAANYIASEFKRLGMIPKGEDGGWFQTVPFWVPTPESRSLSIDGGETIAFGRDYVEVVLGRPAAAGPGPFDVVYGGSVYDSAAWIDAAHAAGKLVVLDAGTTSGDAPVQLNPIATSRHFAGAAGIALARPDLTPDAAANFMRYTPRPDTTRFAGRPAMIVMTMHAADLLLGKATGARHVGDAGRRVTGSISLHYIPVAYPARNVIGVVEGSDPKLRGEYVSLTAHNDHVGICMSAVDHDSMRAFLHVLRPMGADTRTWNETPEADATIHGMIDSMRRLHPPRADSICNGADDDGSGTAAILELAESFASLPQAQRPRRSILFVSHVAEERGLVGSAWFTDHATVPVDSIVAEIDEDMVGRGTAWDLPKGGPTYLEVVGARRLSNEFGDLLEAANRKQRVPFVFNYEFDAPHHPLQYYCRADHYSYARYGIPSVAFSRGEHLDYHQVTDEPQYIDYDDMLRVVQMVHDAALSIGNLDHAPRLDQPKGDPHARCVQ
jgi:hypothetical protein